MLDVQNINQYYGSSHTLRGITMSVKQGECMALLGRNGVGKTTLLQCLMGVQPLASGSIHFDGKDISKLAPHARAALGMAYVPQGREIFARLTVEENILMGMATKPSQQAKRIKNEIFDLFPVLRTMLSRRGGDLSGGQQQQLAIARALVAEPKLIIFDEPTEGIQPSVVLDIQRAVGRIIRETGISVLLVEHHASFVRQSDCYYAMQKGGIVASGATADLSSEMIQRFLSV